MSVMSTMRSAYVEEERNLPLGTDLTVAVFAGPTSCYSPPPMLSRICLSGVY